MLDMQAVLTQSGKGVSATGMKIWFGSSTHDALHTRVGDMVSPHSHTGLHLHFEKLPAKSK